MVKYGIWIMKEKENHIKRKNIFDGEYKRGKKFKGK